MGGATCPCGIAPRSALVFRRVKTTGVMFASLLAIDEPLTSVGTNDPFFCQRMKQRKVSQSDQRTMHPPHPVRAKWKSCSTSAANGVDPSAPRTPSNSSINVATARATAHDNQPPRLFRSSTRSLLGLWRVPTETRNSWSHSTTRTTKRAVWPHQLRIRPCFPSANRLKSDSIKVGGTSPGAPI